MTRPERLVRIAHAMNLGITTEEILQIRAGGKRGVLGNPRRPPLPQERRGPIMKGIVNQPADIANRSFRCSSPFRALEYFASAKKEDDWAKPTIQVTAS